MKSGELFSAWIIRMMKFKNSKSAKICIRTQKTVVCAILLSVTHLSKAFSVHDTPPES